ncbi:PAS domain S-box protein [Humidesulfovibrio sp.]|uniref:PAS domain S-box protein n=1 Tax=Humidesulfovibrio sp. TaxID=2910988 RepID=UPI00280AAC3F|nr:PAS domain S-box protein [Humidesulfovibrio sp.]
MPSDPPLATSMARTCPVGAERPALGGLSSGMILRLCLALLFLSGLPTPPLDTALAASKARQQKELLAAAPANLPPFYAPAADGQPGGFAIEILRRVAENSGYALRVLPTASVADAERLLRQGKVHVIPGLDASPARERAMGFTRPFDILPVHIFFRSGSPPLETLASLDGKRLALVAGTIPEDHLMGRVELHIRLTQTLAEAIFEVLSGQSDALIHLAPVVRQAAQAAGVEHKLQGSALPLYEVGQAMAVNRDMPQLLAQLDKGLEDFRDTPDFRELYRKWHPAPATPHFTSVALWTMGVLAVVLSAALLAWRYVSLLRVNRRLMLTVAERDRALAAQCLTEDRLQALFTLAHMGTASTEELVEFALEQGVRLTGSSNGYLIFVEEKGDGEVEDRGRAVWSKTARERCTLLPDMHADATFTLSRAGLWANCLRDGVPSIVNDYAAHPGRRPLPEGHAPIARHMGVPLVENGRSLAMFGVGDKPEPYDETDARQLQLFLSGLWRVLKARRDADAIRQAKDYAESLLEGASTLIVGLDRAGRVTAFNAAAEKLIGRARGEMLGQDWISSMYPPSQASAITARFRRIMDGDSNIPLQNESTLRTSSGEARLISWQNSVLRQGGEITGLIAFGLDITERREAEKALKTQNRENMTLLNGVPALIFFKSLDNRILRANEAWFKTLGLDESILGVPLDQVFPAELATKFHRDDMEVIQSGRAKMNIMEVVATPQGTRRYITHKLPQHDASGTLSGIICIATDVTDLHLAEEALAQSEEKFRTLAEDSPALICRFLPGGIITYVNKILCSTFGRTAEQLLNTCLLEHVPEEDRPALLARFASLTPEAPVIMAEQRVFLPGGRIGWLNWTDRALFDADGNITAYQSVGMDITARKLAELDLRRLHRAIEHAAEGLLITDRSGAITYTNPALERMTGLSGDKVKDSGLFMNEVLPIILRHQDSQPRQGEDGGVWRGNSSLTQPHGQTVEVEFTVSATRNPSGEISSFVAVCRDVTEKRLLERQLWQAQKMEALGTLAGGIAHDFNNILASIMGFTELALDDIPASSRAKGSLMRVLKASSRAKELVRQILTFGRRSDREQRALDPDQVVNEALRLMEASLPKDIEIRAELEAKGCFILADPSQVHQIVMNLCTNAAQAMKDGGGIRVATRVVRLDEDSPSPEHSLQTGEYLSLTVEDSGAGIAPNIMGRIFDPFFTTKDSGEGTGLGLAVVHGIVSSLGGAVFARSEPGQGARLTVLLPTAQGGHAQEPAHSQRNTKGSERILLVDDETDLLDLMRLTLEPLGYQVSTRSQPEAALKDFLSSPQSFDLVLTDQSMPRLTGVQLATRLREARPDMPIVLCTGFSMVIPPDRLQALGEAWLLPKPFSTDELAGVIRQALANSRGGPDAT